ncbi:uncharacterized protein LOC111291081 [Durio zibethinus]|uniref:Uncharacterized protein LOC111291081 n=1 Tax=Durio zibethinus TaxID=66656 RepID=A0A6P5YED4_DURZI|nr:uncharacterized protein LOC111291081 [Durio zibethinus]
MSNVQSLNSLFLLSMVLMFSFQTNRKAYKRKTMAFRKSLSFGHFFINASLKQIRGSKIRTLRELIADMVHFIKFRGKRSYPSPPRFMGTNNGSELANVLSSPGSVNVPKHAVIVMDGLKEFTTELLEWVLKNIIATGHTVTLLGFMPWLNIPLSSKTWQDVWMLEFEHLSLIKEKNEWKNDAKYVKLQAVLDLCQKHGVVPQKEVVMGYPLPLLVVERIISFRATWVVFDRNRDLRKNMPYFAKKIPGNLVMVNEEGHMDLIKGRPMIDNGDHTPCDSPAPLAPTPIVIYSEPLRRILEEQELEKDDNYEFFL